MPLLFRRHRWWFAVNLVGLAVYLWLASRTWLEPELRGENVGQAGDAIVWALTALPVLMFAAVANVVWFIMQTIRRPKDDQAWVGPAGLVIAGLWVIAFLVDRHGGFT
jgi:hypothetical protein